MSLYTGKIGLEDLALGTGKQVQNLGRGRTRTITEINAGNLPFGPNTTFKQAMDNFTAILHSAEALNITENKDAILKLSADINKLKKLSDELPELHKLIDKDTLLNTLVANIDSINYLEKTIHKTEQAVRDTEYRECRILDAEKTVNKRLAYVSNIINNDILPKKDALDKVLPLLYAKIDSVKAELTLGNEMAHKLATYEWKLDVTRRCKMPSWFIDEDTKKIIIQMPKPTCVTAVTVDCSEECSGGSGSGLVPVTQDAVNEAFAEGVA